MIIMFWTALLNSLEAEATLKQDGEKDTQDITLVVVKVDGKWVIVSGL